MALRMGWIGDGDRRDGSRDGDGIGDRTGLIGIGGTGLEMGMGWDGSDGDELGWVGSDEDGMRQDRLGLGSGDEMGLGMGMGMRWVWEWGCDRSRGCLEMQWIWVWRCNRSGDGDATGLEDVWGCNGTRVCLEM